MRPTIPALLKWQPQTFADAGTCASEAAEALDTAVGRAVTAFDSARSWRGLTHAAAQRRVGEEHDHADEVRNVLQMIADEASDAAVALTHARDHALRLLDTATDGGFRIAEDATVTHPDPDRAASAADLTGQITAALSTIDELDELYGTRLDGYTADLASMIDGQPDVTLPGGTMMDPDDAVMMLRSLTESQIRDVLEKMSPADVRRLVQANPHVMGNLPGVPFEWRIPANEVNIRNALAEEIRAGRGQGRRARTLREMLEPVADPTNPNPAAGDDGLVERQFITFVNTPRGRMVEMVGTLRRNTRNVAVYVPGTGTNMDSAGGDNRRAAAELAAQTDGPVFLYLDGDLPQDLVAATSTGYAAEMAPRLAVFGHELDAELAEHAPAAKSTFIGHSYGGSVVGTAEQLGLAPDRVIYASAAGTGILDLPHPAGVDRYALTFPGDPIHISQLLPFNPHGADPDTTADVTRLATGTVEIDGKTYVGGLKTHGGYWNDPDSTAFQNMVKVITGEDPVLHGRDRPSMPSLPTPPPAPPWWTRLFDDAGPPGPLPDIPLPRVPGLPRLPIPLPIPDVPLRLPW
ncbi:alpha/beta hydrolase [Gordonia paraffinivorans]|uniref:alpha/beta hydrolase n=1 Tax=Gordonia paraffinivorans TaxID=175628 RepID=UPI003FCE8D40